MRKLFLFSLVVMLFVMAGSALAQQDSDADDGGQSATVVQQRRSNLQAAEDIALGWIEIRLTNVSPLVYAPERCIRGDTDFDTVIWEGNRYQSLQAARDGGSQFNQPQDVLVSVACDVSLYTTPGGERIDDVLLRAGQTWFASPYR